MWSTRRVPVTQLAGRSARIDVSIDGIRFSRSDSDAARRGTEHVTDVDWDHVTGATVQSSRKGRPVIRVAVSGWADVADHRHDPHAVTLRRDQAAAAATLVEGINAEVEVRNRWREQSQSSG